MMRHNMGRMRQKKKHEAYDLMRCKARALYHSEDLSFCDQVSLMSSTDIVASPHGAQLTNQVLMDRGSSVMELFPRGLTGVANMLITE
ncbi:hypothetical protein MKX01_029569 [Papaver californicum]|nr:hypothetical protein MKX01_029569 [Papaver californicum]